MFEAVVLRKWHGKGGPWRHIKTLLSLLGKATMRGSSVTVSEGPKRTPKKYKYGQTVFDVQVLLFDFAVSNLRS